MVGFWCKKMTRVSSNELQERFCKIDSFKSEMPNKLQPNFFKKFMKQKDRKKSCLLKSSSPKRNSDCLAGHYYARDMKICAVKYRKIERIRLPVKIGR